MSLETRSLPYLPTPSSNGIEAADYALIHGEHGEVFRYWIASEELGVNRNGKTYEEATLGAPGKGLFYSTKREIESEQFGILPVGSTMFSCLPSVVEIYEGGMLLRSAPKQARTTRAVITRGTTDTDPLPRRFVTAIRQVKVNDVAVSLTTVQAVSADSPNDDDLGGLKWLSGAPAAGAKIAVVYSDLPFYVCLSESIQGEPIGTDGELLPQRVLLREERS